MAAFASRMLEAKHAKMARRNRGESVGRQRGTRALTLAERAAIDPPPGSWERLLAETRIRWRNASSEARTEFRFTCWEIHGDRMEIPF